MARMGWHGPDAVVEKKRTVTDECLETIRMTETGNPIFNNLARLMTDAAGMATGVKREAEGVMKAQLERLIRDMDVVSREEFEAVRTMAILAREENERLAARLAELEQKIG